MELKLDALLNEASRRTDGLSDFGDERFRVPAQVLLSVHPLDAREADEEGMLLEHSFWARGIAHSMAVRDAMPAGRFLDVWLSDTLNKPLEVVRSIYDWLNISFPADTRERTQAYLEAHSREKNPVREYGLEHFDLSEQQIKVDFASCRKAYILHHDS